MASILALDGAMVRSEGWDDIELFVCGKIVWFMIFTAMMIFIDLIIIF